MDAYCYRCTTCNKNYPREDLYRNCIACGELCWSKQRYSNDHVLTDEEIRTLIKKTAEVKAIHKSHEDFEKFCAERDDKQIQADIARHRSEEPLYAEHLTG